MNSATILNVVLLIILAYTIWSHEKASSEMHYRVSKLEQGHWSARDALSAELAKLKVAYSDLESDCAMAEELAHHEGKLKEALKGEKVNLLEIIKDRNETIQLHKDRDTHHAAQLQAARRQAADYLTGRHHYYQEAAQRGNEVAALQVRVGQQEQALKAHEESQALAATQVATWKARHDTLGIRNENQRLVIESLRDIQVTLEEARALYREGALVPRDLVTLAETIKAHLSAGLVGDAEVARLGGSLSRAVQVYRKASTSKTNAQELQDELKTPVGGILQEILEDHQAM